MIKWIGGMLVAALVAGVGFLFLVLPPRVDAERNAVVPHAPYVISDQAQALHDTLVIADLHADTMLWARDPAMRHTRGQTDLPRLREGGVNIQVFSATTKSPSGQNYDENTDKGDQIRLCLLYTSPSPRDS